MDKFILVEKDDEQIEIHPLALEDHKRLGWKVVGEQAVAAEAAPDAAPDDAAEEKKRKREAKQAAKKTAAKE